MRRHPLRAKSARSLKPTVERVESRVLLATFTVTNTNDDTNPGSLGYAITESNATPGSNIIKFNIAPSGVQTIALQSTLPAITVPVTIDGTTEPGYAGTPLIELDGAGVSGGDGLDITAGDSTVKGLDIDRFGGNGITLSTAGGDLIAQDYLGTDPTGATAEGDSDGVLVQSGNNDTISGNLASGDRNNGIELNGSTSGDLIVGNLMGTDVTGAKAIPDGNDGLSVQGGSQITIGGTTPASRNVMSADSTGLSVNSSDGVVIAGNYIGTDVTGELALGNHGDGIFLGGSASDITIGGSVAGAGNLVDESGNRGIEGFESGPGLLIAGNFIGTDATGMKALGNVLEGMDISGPANTTIGGTIVGARNVISGNGPKYSRAGILAYTNGMLIEGNYLGVAADGTTSLGNGGDGIYVSGNNVSIGGLAAGQANIIANNGYAGENNPGVWFNGTPTGVSILSNSIYDNPIGIKLDGANNNQASPVLSSANSTGNEGTISGSLTSAGGTYTLQIFASPTLDPGGFAEGQTLLGTESLTTNGATTNFSYTFPQAVLDGNYITATATNSAGETSDFSTGLLDTTPPTPPTISVESSSQSVIAGQQLTDTFTITNPGTGADAGVVFSDSIPAHTTFVSGFTTTRVSVILSGGVATANLGTLTPGETVILSLVLMTSAAAEPSFTNTGSLTATTPPLTSGTDTASVTTTILPSADLGVATSGPSATLTTTNKLAFKATVTDAGPDAAKASTLTDTFTLPSGATLSSESVSQGMVSVSGDVVTASFGTIAKDSTAILTVVVATTVSGTFAESAVVTATTADPNMNNNAASTSVMVSGLATVSLIPLSHTVTPGKTTTLSAQVSVPPGFVAATRSVTFYDGSTALGSATLNASGQASLVVTLHSAGDHFLSVAYPGDSNYAATTSAPTPVRVGDTVYGDYDGDGKSDIAIYDQTSATFYILYSGGGSRVQQLGNVNHTNIPVVGDFDGDGKDDLAIYDQTAAEFFILYSGGGSLALPFGNPTHVNIPVAGDFDGDGKTDIAIYDQTAAEFFILYSNVGSLAQPFGNPRDVNIPVAGDFDGDGKSDIAIYDQTAATFYVLYSGGGSRMQQLGNVNHTNIPVSGDFDGDGKSDLTVYDQTNGYLYSLDSGGGTSALLIGRTAQVDIPLSGDFDGDGKTDVGIYDETDGEFFVVLSAGGSLTQPFGNNKHSNWPI